MIPLSLYIHIPWCVKKCPYCDFNSHVFKKGKSVQDQIEDIEDQYVDALIDDLSIDIQRYQITRPIHSIFIGGGTPSLFSDRAISKLLNGVNKLISFEPNIEITLETNPGTAEIKFIEGYLKAGVTRISLGVQSFQDEYLTKLGRIHDHKQALKAIELVDKVGFKQWNIDLMYGLPQQTIEDAQKDIDLAISISPPHLSAYHMTIEPNTTFAVKPPKLPEDDVLEKIHDMYSEQLTDNGYIHYEVSAHAKVEENICRHNTNYWQFGDYLGIGAGAHGKITSHIDGKVAIIRTEKTPSPTMYMNELSVQKYTRKSYSVVSSDILLEYGMNSLRLKDGFKFTDFTKRTGLGKEVFNPFFDQVKPHQWLDINEQRVKPTEKGRLFLNSMLTLLSDVNY